tara:strand:- start:3375 stop:3599 length:225 start_codon:yes stop_codon:yes gene_type:complete
MFEDGTERLLVVNQNQFNILSNVVSDYLNTLELGNERNQLISLNAHLQRQWDADYFRKMLSIYPQEKSNESSRK